MDVSLEGQVGELHFTIRPVNENGEAGAILEVYRQCEDFLALGPVAQASMQMVQVDLAHSRDEGGVFCGIYAHPDGQMMGIVDFMQAGFNGEPELAFISLLMIAAPHRSQGLGAAVVTLVEGWIRVAGKATAIEAGVQVNNPQAIRFWERMGYKIVSGPIEYADGTTAYRLWRSL
jgi:ribosomal protein S18 acetylase RimI-like enzyme